MRGLLLIMVAGGLALWASAAAGRNVFVDNLRGNDRSMGVVAGLEAAGVGNGPVRTLGRALRLAQPGDRIVLAATDRPYRESVTLSGARHSGDQRTPFTIAGNGAVLDGSAPVPTNAWEPYRGNVFRFRPERLAHQQLFLDGRPAPRVASAGPATEVPRLSPGEWCLHGSHIYFAVARAKLPSDYPLSYAKETVGISLVHVRHVAIADLTVQGFQLDGINAANDARRVTLLGVTCRGNGRAGVAVGGACQVNLEQCVLGDNAVAQLLTLPWSETHVTRSELLPKTAPAWLTRGGSLTVDGKPVREQSGPAQ